MILEYCVIYAYIMAVLQEHQIFHCDTSLCSMLRMTSQVHTNGLFYNDN